MQEKTFQTLSYEIKDNGVAIISIDVKDRPVNVLTLDMYNDFHQLVEVLSSDASVKGAVICSAKKTFMAGGDLKRIVNLYAQNRTAEEAYNQSRDFTTALRKLELCGKPIAVAINGSAMGGGLELALACNYRVVVDEPKVFLALPEVSIGLVPGAGGTQRLPRLIGIEKASELILTGKVMTPQEALAIGVVDKVVPRDQLIEEAQKLVLGCENSSRPWDRRGFQIPGGSGLTKPKIGALFQRLTMQVNSQYHHNYPAPIAALRCLFNGSTIGSMDKALECESLEFSQLTRRVESRNIIRTTFLNKGAMDRLSAKPEGEPNWKAATAVVQCNDNQLLGHVKTALSKAKITVQDSVEHADIALLLHGSTLDYVRLTIQSAPSSVVVVRDEDLLSQLLSAGDLANNGQFIGLNGLGEKGAQCLELGRLGALTSSSTFARTLDFCRQLRKTPTVQKFEKRWFSRACFSAFKQEAESMLSDGVSAALINNAAKFANFNQLPLAIPCAATDSVEFDIEKVTERLFAAQALVAFEFLEAGLIEAADADVTSVLSYGFPSWAGGVLSYIETQGIKRFVESCDQLLAEGHDQFLVPQALRDLTNSEDGIYPKFI